MAALGVETNKGFFVKSYLVSLYTRRKLSIYLHQFASSFERLSSTRWREWMENLTSTIPQPETALYLFEPMASGHDSRDNNSRESDSASEDGNCDVNQELIGQADW